jgi:hypothetical protein
VKLIQSADSAWIKGKPEVICVDMLKSPFRLDQGHWQAAFSWLLGQAGPTKPGAWRTS